jgi:hypothetical protein
MRLGERVFDRALHAQIGRFHAHLRRMRSADG